MLDVSGPIFETLRGQITASTTADGDRNPIDLTEAFLEWRPYPQSHWRWRSRLGAFYPPISLENRGVGWQSLYSLSASAINTWIGEEIRAIGLEVALTNVGATAQRPFDRGAWIADYWSYFALASQELGRHRLTLRYDSMHVKSTRGAAIFNSRQDAHAWTVAYLPSGPHTFVIVLAHSYKSGAVGPASVGIPALQAVRTRLH
jgi:hypothetical protein